MESTVVHLIEWRLIDTLIRAKRVLESMSGGGAIVHQGAGFGDAHNDTEIRADRELGRLISEDFRRFDGIGTILCEGMDPVVLLTGHCLIDPLVDRLITRRTRNVSLPYTATVILRSRKQP